MNWQPLTNPEQLTAIKQESFARPVVLFKHSTRCSISTMAKARLERETAPDKAAFYYLDLLQYRQVSNQIADVFQVPHESPQVLLIKDGVCIYDESHNGIDMFDIQEQIETAWPA